MDILEKETVVFIINSLYRAGAERLVVDDINEMLRRGIEVRLLTLRPEKSGLSFDQECNISESNWVRIRFSGFLDIGAWIKIVRQLRAWRSTAVVTHLWFANTVGRIASRLAGVEKIISFEHNIYEDIKSRKQFLADKLLARFSWRIVAVSGAVRNSLTKHGIPSSKVVILHNGVKLDRYRGISRENARDKLGIGHNEFVFLFVGRLTKQKGVDTLLRAFSEAAKGTLFIVGDGEERKYLEDLAGNLGVAGRTRFFGQRPDIPEFLAAADCFILPSHWEGFGMVVLEAMASGIPVIASRVDGIKELIEDGRTGILVDPGDTTMLGRAMRGLAEDDPLRKRFSENSSREISEFSIERHAEKLIEMVFDSS